MFNWVKTNENGEILEIGKTFQLPNDAICIDNNDIDVNEIQNYKYSNGEFVKYERKTIINWDEIRQQRNSLLRKTDWTQLGDCLSEKEKEQYRIYRQALRDIPQQYENPKDIVWPQLKDYLYKLPEKQNILKKLFTKTKSIDLD